MFFDPLSTCKAQKLTKMLPFKDEWMKRQKYFFLKKTSNLVKTTNLMVFSLNYWFFPKKSEIVFLPFHRPLFKGHHFSQFFELYMHLGGQKVSKVFKLFISRKKFEFVCFPLKNLNLLKFYEKFL